MSRNHKHRYNWSTATIHLDVGRVLDLISSKAIAEEHSGRVAEEITNQERFKFQEKFREDDQIDVDIDLEAYELMYYDDACAEDFDSDELIEELNDRGYLAIENDRIKVDSELAQYLRDMPGWKFKDLMCDVLGFSYCAGKEEIMKELESKIQ